MLELFHWALYSTGYLTVAVVLLWAAAKFFDLCTPYSLKDQLTEKDNPAVGIVLTGFLAGVTALICGLFYGEGPQYPTAYAFLSEMQEIVPYGLIGIVLLFAACIINDKLVLRQFSNRHEIIERRNTAVATVAGASILASGLIIAGGICGCVNIISLLLSFLLGQLLLIVYAIIYQRITSYDDQKELGENKNVAAAFGFGGNLIAYGLVLMKGMSLNLLDTWDWSRVDKLINIGYYAITGLVLLTLARVVTDFVFLPRAKISKEIAQDANINAGLLEAMLAVAMGCAMAFCL